MRHYLTILFAFAVCSATAQSIAVKTNLLYDASATVNVGLEVALGRRTTLDISGNYNAWNTDSELNEKMRHALIQPEFRYYLCERMSGHFFGVHAHMLQYNISGDHWLPNIFKNASTFRSNSLADSRYQGEGYGAGLTYGYDWVIAPRFNIEFSVGAGYVFFDYERYGKSECSPCLEWGDEHYFGLTKLGVSLVYIIK